MDKHYGVIDSAGLVTMVVVWDGVQDYSPGGGLSLVALPYETDEDGTVRYTAGSGFSYRDGQFIDER